MRRRHRGRAVVVSVENHVVMIGMFANARLKEGAEFWNVPQSTKCTVQHGFICFDLILAPLIERVLKDVVDVLLGPGRKLKLRT